MDKVYLQLKKYLNDNRIGFREIEHAAGDSAEAYHEAVGCKWEEQGKCLLVKVYKDNNKQFYIYVLPANKKGDLEAIRTQLAAKTVKMATREELKETTGCDYGELSPLAGDFGIKLIMDKSFLDQKEIFMSAGDAIRTFVVAIADLVRLENPIILDNNRKEISRDIADKKVKHGIPEGGYDHRSIEDKWKLQWKKKLPYKAEDFAKKPKYYALVEFPYPSGEGLHVGHASTYLLLDPVARKKRMEGFNVLYPMGWDAFGLPTENYAVKTGIQPKLVTRQNTDRFRTQFDMLSIAYDWDREINTTDPNYFCWTQWIFMQMFKNGLAYKSETPVGWCPSCKIVLANEEIVSGECERCGTTAEKRLQKQWILRITNYADRLAAELDSVDYPESAKTAQRKWIGRKEWIDINYPIEGIDRSITVSTTRPDTNFGATFVVLAPEHDLVRDIVNGNIAVSEGVREAVAKYVKSTLTKTDDERIVEGKEKTGVFTGLYAVNQLNDRKLPIWVTDFVLTSVGTGAVVGVPGHDKRDFEFAQKFSLPVIRVVVGRDGDKSDITDKSQVQEEEGSIVNSGFLDGLDIHAATTRIMDYLEAKGWGRRTVRYHLRDWIFSRQHYWGEPIPMVYCEKCARAGITWWDIEESKKMKPLFNPAQPTRFQGEGVRPDLQGWFPIKEEQLPLKLPQVDKYQPSETGESPLANIKKWVSAPCPNCGETARRETDTMPNWAGSSWYYLAFAMAEAIKSRNQKVESRNEDIFTENKKLLDYWMPVDVYMGGAEHTTLHLLYSRFWHKFLNDLGVVPGIEPYKKRRQHGMILAENGEKMSKSRGNVINPDSVIEENGLDAMRLYLAFMGPFDQTMPWSTSGVEGAQRFLRRVWGMYQTNGKVGKVTSGELIVPLNQLIKKVGDDIDNFKNNTAVAAMMQFLNLWSEKGTLNKEDAEKFIKLLSPFAPHIAEEIWVERLGNKYSITQQPWPGYENNLIAGQFATIVVQINGKTRGSVQIPSNKVTQDIAVNTAISDSTIAKHLTGVTASKIIWVEGKLVNFVLKQ